MDIKAILATHRRDLRLDLFRGLANWSIFLDHIPDNWINTLTTRNFGFSGATDLFLFTSGYAVALIYAKMMLERGFIIGATRLSKRAFHLYAAYVVLFVIYIVTVNNVAAHFAAPEIIYDFNVAGLVDHPIRILAHGLLLQSRARNLDLLQLYTGLMALFPPVLWMMLRRPHLTLAGSVALYAAARAFDWNLPSFPDGNWYYNPFCWQIYFVFGAWLALGGGQKCRALMKLKMLPAFGIAYLLFALAMTLAGRFPDFGNLFPAWLLNGFVPNEKTNLAPSRLLHFILLLFFVTRLLPRDWHGLSSPLARPLIICGQQSLAVFCAGVLLAFAGHLLLITGSGSLLAQVLVSAGGIAIMVLCASYISWSKQLDESLQSGNPPPARSIEAQARS
jgi:hypothetical protein